MNCTQSIKVITLSHPVLTSDIVSFGPAVEVYVDAALADYVVDPALTNTVAQNSANWNSVFSSYNVNSAEYITIPVTDARYLHLSGGVLNGSLSAFSISTNNLYVGENTINFFDSNLQISETLNGPDVTTFKSLHTTVNTNSANWANSNLGDLVIVDDQISSSTNNIHLLANNTGRVELKADDGINGNYLWVQTDGIGIQNNNGEGNHFLWQFNADGTTTFPNPNNGIAAQIDSNGNAVFNGILTAYNINSTQWDNVYTTVLDNSATWQLSAASLDLSSPGPIGNNTSDTGKFTFIHITGDIISDRSSGLTTFGYSDPSIAGVYGGFDGSTIHGAYFQLFGKNNAGTGTTPPGGGEFVLNSENGATKFVISDFDGTNFNPRMVVTSDGKIGIGTTTPNENLTVAGNILADVIYTDDGNSDQWNSTYTTVLENSTSWMSSAVSIETDPLFTTWAHINSAHYESTFSTVQDNSASWIDVPETDPVFTTWALANSARYDSSYNTVILTSSVWNDTSTTVQDNSALWNNSSSVDIIGTANQINVASASGVYTISLPSSPHIAGTLFVGGGMQWGDNDIAGAVKGFIDMSGDGVFRFGDSSGGGSPSIILGSIGSSAGIRINRNGIIASIRNGDDTADASISGANGIFSGTLSALDGNSSQWNSSYATMLANSASWINVPETDPIFTTWALANSAHYQSTYTTVNINSASWINSSETDPVFSTWALANSAHYQSAYTTVNANSASWINVPETDPVFTTWALVNSAHYQSTYTNMSAHSASWINVPETDPVFNTWALANSAHYQSAFTTVNANSALWTDDTLKIADIGIKVPPLYTPLGITYISSNGDDTLGTGAMYSPFATIQKAYNSGSRYFIFLGGGPFGDLIINTNDTIRVQGNGIIANVGTINVNGANTCDIYDVGGRSVSIDTILMGADGISIPGDLNVYDIAANTINSSGANGAGGTSGPGSGASGFNGGNINAHGICNIGVVASVGGTGMGVNFSSPAIIVNLGITNVGGGAGITFTTSAGAQTYSFDSAGGFDAGASTGVATTDAAALAATITNNGTPINIIASDNGNGTINVSYNGTGQTTYISWTSTTGEINVPSNISDPNNGTVNGTGYNASGGSGGNITISGASFINLTSNLKGTGSGGTDNNNNPTIDGQDGIMNVSLGTTIITMAQGTVDAIVNGAMVNGIFQVADNTITPQQLQAGIPATKLQLTDIQLDGSQIVSGYIGSNHIIETDPVFNTWASANSANYQSTYTTVNSHSAAWGSGSGTETDPLFTTWASANSANYQSTYTTVNANSASWTSLYTGFNLNSANWNSNYTSFNVNSANFQNTFNAVKINSANWNSVYTFYNINSAVYQSNFTTLNSNSANWNSNYTVFNLNSSFYQNTYNILNSNSANWNSGYTLYNVSSALYQSNFTTTNTNSANWNSNYTSFNVNSANFQSSYTNLNANSGIWGSTYTTVHNSSATWGVSALDIGGTSSQGDILYRGSTGWVRLPAGTAGQVLKTYGLSANPAWITIPWSEGIALSDLTTALTVSTSVAKGQITLPLPVAISSVQFDVLTAPTGANLQFDVKKNGNSIYSTKPTIDTSEFSTTTAAITQVLSGTTSGIAGDVFSFFVTQIGSTIAGAGLQAHLIGNILI